MTYFKNIALWPSLLAATMVASVAADNVRIKHKALGKYLKGEEGTKADATLTTVDDAWEEWEIVRFDTGDFLSFEDMSRSYVAIRNKAHGNYLSAYPPSDGGQVYLTSNRNSYEKFKIVEKGNGLYCIKSMKWLAYIRGVSNNDVKQGNNCNTNTAWKIIPDYQESKSQYFNLIRHSVHKSITQKSPGDVVAKAGCSVADDGWGFDGEVEWTLTDNVHRYRGVGGEGIMFQATKVNCDYRQDKGGWRSTTIGLEAVWKPADACDERDFRNADRVDGCKLRSKFSSGSYESLIATCPTGYYVNKFWCHGSDTSLAITGARVMSSQSSSLDSSSGDVFVMDKAQCEVRFNDWRDSAQIVALCAPLGCPVFDGYEFIPHKDSPGNKLPGSPLTDTTVSEMVEWCNEQGEECKVFNTNGHMKSKAVTPYKDWNSDSPCDGIYVKKCPQFRGYDFIQHKDSYGNKLSGSPVMAENTVAEMVEWCNNNDDCKVFNTNGHMKDKLALSYKDWNSDSPCDGIYVKKCPKIRGYEFISRKDSPQNDIKPKLSNLDLGYLESRCNNHKDCKGFNTNGYMKSKVVEPYKDWDADDHCDGLYVKK